MRSGPSTSVGFHIIGNGPIGLYIPIKRIPYERWADHLTCDIGDCHLTRDDGNPYGYTVYGICIPSIGFMTHPLTQGDNESLDHSTYDQVGMGPRLVTAGSCLFSNPPPLIWDAVV